MCDFHSVIVTNDGRILHLRTNSHADIVQHYSLDTSVYAKWFECEWNGEGDMPPVLVQTRGKRATPTQLAYRAADSHYRKLSQIVAGELDPQTVAPFHTRDYSDVQERYSEAQALKQADGIAELFAGMSDATAQAVIRRLVDKLSLDMSEIAQEEIERAIENDETRYNAGYDAGIEAASEDMYSYDYLQEEVESAVTRAQEEARQEGYGEGFAAAIAGAKPTAEYINGLPAFLSTK